MSTILGIDPSTYRVGYALLDDAWEITACGVIQTKTSDTHQAKLATIYDDMMALLDAHKEELSAVAIETAFVGINYKTALIIAQARGVILAACGRAGVPIMEYPPSTVKKAIAGNGHANKKAMQQAIKAAFKLEQIIEPHDANDAVAIALCHKRHHTTVGRIA